MSYNYCTCSLDPSKDKATSQGRTPYRLVLVNKEDICLDCGHYTIVTNRQVSAKGGELYSYITGYKTDAEKLLYKQNWYNDKHEQW